MPYFWDYMNFGRPQRPTSHRNLQDGLFQIATQTCSLLVQVNNTNNISYGHNSTNVHCNSAAQTVQRSRNSHGPDDEQFMVLLPTSTAGTTTTSASSNSKTIVGYKPSHRSKSRLSTVLENESFSHEEEGEFLGQRYNFRDDDMAVKSWNNRNGWCRPSCIPISIILVLIFLVVLLPLVDNAVEKSNNNVSQLNGSNEECTSTCRISFVESIPENLTYPNGTTPYPSTYSTWMNLISLAQSTIEIGSYYWTLRSSDVTPPDPSSWQGENVFQSLLDSGRMRGIKVKIAQNAPSKGYPNLDTEYLVKRKAAQVRNLNFAQLLGSGILHTKLWIVDRKHFYVGSANFDWRSLTQVKELGIVAYNCSCLAEDMAKIFEVYWILGKESAVPPKWPIELETKINLETPANLSLNNDTYLTYISSSPLPFNPDGRTNDIDAILNTINQAEKFIYISVMDYFPLLIYTPKIQFWPIIDDALKRVAIEHKVHVRLLISWWKYSMKSEDNFLKSLNDISESSFGVHIEVRRFIVPSNADQAKIPYARVNHNKYMVTDNTVYIGTSNWSGDYFTDTAGIGFILHDPRLRKNETNESLRKQLENIFERDWNSPYSHPLNTSLY